MGKTKGMSKCVCCGEVLPASEMFTYKHQKYCAKCYGLLEKDPTQKGRPQGVGKCSCCGATCNLEDMLTYDRKKYCPTCYRSIIRHNRDARITAEAFDNSYEEQPEINNPIVTDDDTEFEQLKIQIRSIFNITTIPSDWVEKIAIYHDNGMSYINMAQTLKYYYLILGNDPDPSYGLWCIKQHYESALKYFAEQTAIKAYNLRTNAYVAPVNIRMRAPVSQRRLQLYDMSEYKKDNNGSH